MGRSGEPRLYQPVRGELETGTRRYTHFGACPHGTFHGQPPGCGEKHQGKGHKFRREEGQHQLKAHRGADAGRCVRARQFYKIDAGTLIATLATSIFSGSGKGVVFNGSARDLQANSEIEGFNAIVRDFHPSFLEEEVMGTAEFIALKDVFGF